MGSSFNINIENFQSIGQADLTFVPGINIIVGQSNSGKSAIIRAINSVVNNPSRAKHFVKRGTNKATVAIEYDNQTVEWSRTAKESVYTVDEEQYSKVGNKNLFDLIDKSCGFVHDDSNNIMNIEGEWDLPFPFDRTPSETFKLFENIFCVSDSAVILKSYKEEEADLVKKKSNAHDRLLRLESKLEAIEDLKNSINLEEIMGKQKVFESHINKYFELLGDIDYLDRCNKVQDFTLDDVKAPTKFSMDTYIELAKDYQALVEVVKKRKFYKTLPESLIIPNTLEEYIALRKDYECIMKADALNRVDFDKECEITGETLDKYLQLIEDLRFIEHAKKASEFNLPEDYIAKVDMSDYEALLEDYKFIVLCYKKRKLLKENYMKLEEKIQTLQENLSSIKVCPLCGHALEE